jgi:hypothetical protein
VLDSLLIISNHPTTKRSFGDDFADVFEDEVVRLKVDIRAESKAFLLGLNDRNIGVESASEALILAFRTAIAVRTALHLCGAVDAVGVLVTGIVAFGRRICLCISDGNCRRWNTYPILQNNRTQGRFQCSQGTYSGSYLRR